MKNSKETLQLAYEQMLEDREKIKENYEKFFQQVTDLHQYSVNGMNLNKCLELLTKQTQQLLDLAKILESMQPSSEAPLTGRDVENVYDKIRQEGKVKEIRPRSGAK